MRNFLLLLVLFAAGQYVPTAFNPGGPSWTLLQSAFNNFTCAAGTSCTVTMSATTANSLIVFAMIDGSNASNTIASVTGGSGTTTLCPAHSCAVAGSGGYSQDQAYNLNNTGGSTSFTVNITTASTLDGWAVFALEVRRTPSGATLDQVASTNPSQASCSTCNGSTFTSLTGTSDFIANFVSPNNGPPTSPSLPYVVDTTGFWVYALGTTASPATFSQSPASNSASSGLAFK